MIIDDLPRDVARALLGLLEDAADVFGDDGGGNF